MPGKTYFTEEEKDLLQDLINKYKDVIENKRTDAVSLSAKAKAWEILCAEYNSRPFVRARDAKQLKNLWNNMKQRWKREKAKQIRDVMATGGGPPPQPIEDRLAQVEAVVPHLTTRVPNPFDSDRPLDAPSDTQSALEILNGMLHDSGPTDSDEGNN
ncbi:myb/SANT-like DNA-binding domain-containing protein 3 [Dermacentor albipictus]|uniref:myb/SANT-like DNA-binding domain-containing protein 3 n=1 Tax=Dermacentor albipictus TaxID=60249 RepID=UPI0031FCE299